MKPAHPISALFLTLALVSACEVGPNYRRPATPTPGAYKEIEGWTPAHPLDATDRRDWWTVFGDATLNDLETQASASNQTLAAAEAAYRQAHALVEVQRASLFPTLTGDGSANVTGSGGGSGRSIIGSSSIVAGGRSSTNRTYRAQLGATWEPDLWGRIRRSIENAKATAQASAANLANARLSVQLELAADYIQLRQLDEDKRLLDSTADAYQRNLTITQNKYRAGTVSMADVRQAETQLYNTRASDTDLAQQRAKVEHAIAILTGRPPSEVAIPPAPWTLKPLDIPPGLPSTLLERRPDIAQAERLAQAASANIGVATAAYFPSLNLSGAAGQQSSRLVDLFTSSAGYWTAGATAAETILEFGARRGQVSAARAAYDEAVANYRQAVLTAFGQVEDNLAAQRVLAAEQADRQAALSAADDSLRIAQNQYRAGTIDYTTVVISAAAALNAHQTEIALESQRLTTTVDLIVALGGGWTDASLPKS